VGRVVPRLTTRAMKRRLCRTERARGGLFHCNARRRAAPTGPRDGAAPAHSDSSDPMEPASGTKPRGTASGLLRKAGPRAALGTRRKPVPKGATYFAQLKLTVQSRP